MVLSNRENNNCNKTQNKDHENTTKEKSDKFHNGLNTLAEIIAREIYKKRSL
ncbi:hypothetical protein ES703_123419 [subsurface metagenome]